MKKVKQAAYSLLLLVLFSALLAVPAFAADEDLVWVELTKTSGATTAQILTDTTVTDGVVELTYDSSALSYKGVTVTEAYVAMYSVNAEEEGVVRISWVAPGEYAPNAEGASLIQVEFEGEAKKNSVAMTGSANNAAGESVPVEGGPTPEPTATPAPGTDEPGTTAPGTDTPSTTAPTVSGNGASPATGDSAQLGLYIGIAVCAAGALAVTAFVKKRRDER